MIRIEPYADKEVKSVLNRLLEDKAFLNFIKDNLNKSTSKFLSIPGSSFLVLQLFKNKVKNIKTVDEFQVQVKLVLQSIVKQTIENFSTNVSEILEPNKPYLFISNHRDITLDSALCNHAIDSIGLETTYNAIGDNLVSVNWMGDLLRLNKSFVISRSGESKKDIYSNLSRASKFIKEKLENGSHVWIAQKQGRSKDGLDKTDPAVLKMLHIALRKEMSFEQMVSKYNIVPCSISYEIDPLAKEKAQQLNDSASKKDNEDITHIFKGVMLNKGNVALNFDKPIDGDFSAEEMAKEIDNVILGNYKLWDTNIYAYKFLYETVKDDEYPNASAYFNNLRSVMTNKELEYIMNQYANPYKAQMELKDGR